MLIPLGLFGDITKFRILNSDLHLSLENWEKDASNNNRPLRFLDHPATVHRCSQKATG